VQRVSELLPRRPISAQHAVTQQIRGDEGYFIYAPLTGEMDFGCYVGYGLRNAQMLSQNQGRLVCRSRSRREGRGDRSYHASVFPCGLGRQPG
jgi:hypothetical protein